MPIAQMIRSDVTLDLLHSSVSGFTVASTNTSGTTFTVKDFSTAFQIAGGPGQDTIVATDFNFTADQRNAILASDSIERIIDGSRTYTASPVNAPPSLNGVAESASYTEKGAPVTLSATSRCPTRLPLPQSGTVAITGDTFPAMATYSMR